MVHPKPSHIPLVVTDRTFHDVSLFVSCLHNLPCFKKDNYIYFVVKYLFLLDSIDLGIPLHTDRCSCHCHSHKWHCWDICCWCSSQEECHMSSQWTHLHTGTQSRPFCPHMGNHDMGLGHSCQSLRRQKHGRVFIV